MTIRTIQQHRDDTLVISEIEVVDPIHRYGREIGHDRRPGWNVDCPTCGEPVATLLDTPAEARAEAAKHEC